MIDNIFQIKSKISNDGKFTYCHAQDYLDCDFMIKVANPKGFASYQEALETLAYEQRWWRLFEGHSNIIQSYGASAKGVYKQGEHEGVIMYSIHDFWSLNTASDIMKKEGPFSLKFTTKVFRELLSALDFMHKKNYAHLLLCLDNIWLDQDCNVKLAKAERAQFSDCYESKVMHKTGVSYFKAPEMEDDYDDLYDPFMADVYSLAIWIFEMITGHSPSDAHLQRVFYDYECHEKYEDYLDREELDEKPGYEHIPSELRELLSEMTLKEPLNRPSIEELLQSPLLKEIVDKN